MSHQLTQEQINAETDEQLTGIQKSLQRLGDVATGIGNELSTQNGMLGNLETDLSDTENGLSVANNRATQLLARNTRWHYCCILGLCIAILILFLMIVYA